MNQGLHGNKGNDGWPEDTAAELIEDGEREHRNFRAAMLSLMEDLNETTEALTAATQELKKLSMAIEQSVSIVSMTDKSGRIEYVNPTFEEKTAYSKAEAIGRQARELIFGGIADEQYETLLAAVLSGKIWRGKVKNRRKTGGYYWCDTDVCPIKNETGEITHFLINQEDITERIRSEERFQHLARYDALTGLLNRPRFMKLLGEWLDSSGTRGTSGVLFLSDMDQFKLFNETYGHGRGDYILKTMANLINDVVEKAYGESFPHGDGKPFIGRVGGDEFAVFLPSLDGSQGMRMAERIRLAVEEFTFEEADISVTISIGAVLYPDHGMEIKELLTKADAARYRAKELGRNRCHLYRPEDQDLDKVHSKLQWKEKILKALKGDCFEPWFQPILDIGANRVSHYEVLARMIEEDGRVVLPGSFIDVAEWFGLIAAIDRVIIEKALNYQVRLNVDICLSINLSGKDLGDEELLTFLKSKITETGADPRRIIFEITETAAISNFELAVKFVKALKSIGCKFALDDFGVGFTSFTYLKKLMVDYIKIDGAFIRRLHESADDQVFVKAIIDVARGLKIKTIAEFVEQEETLNVLKTYGGDHAQGYFIGKPAPFSELKKKTQA